MGPEKRVHLNRVLAEQSIQILQPRTDRTDRDQIRRPNMRALQSLQLLAEHPPSYLAILQQAGRGLADETR